MYYTANTHISNRDVAAWQKMLRYSTTHDGERDIVLLVILPGFWWQNTDTAGVLTISHGQPCTSPVCQDLARGIYNIISIVSRNMDRKSDDCTLHLPWSS